MRLSRLPAIVTFAALLAAAIASPAEGRTYRATVAAVVDGDTVRVKAGGRTRTLELAGVDAPSVSGEGSCFGAQARSRLRRLLRKGRRVKVRTAGRRAAEIFKGRTSINRALVKDGYARAGSAKGRLGRRLARDAAAARSAGRGLWKSCAAQPDAPGGTTAPPTGGEPPPPAAGDVTGQAAIDQMTAELRDGFWRVYSSSGDVSDKYELNLCGDGRFRYLHDTMYTTPDFSQHYVYQSFGNPWSVKEALIKADGSYRGAVVVGTITRKRTYNGDDPSNPTDEPANEPVEIPVEWQQGQWYVGKKSAQYQAGQASCEPNP